MLKILIVSPKFHPIIGGGETYVLNTIKRLHLEGYDVSIAVEPNEDRNLEIYPYNVYEVEGLSDVVLKPVLAASNLGKILEREKPDIIHAHGYFALLALGLCNTTNIPILASIHSTPVWGMRIFGGMHNFDAELEFARKVLDISKPKLLSAANDVYADAANKVSDGRVDVSVLPYPVDTEFFTHQTNSKLREDYGIKSTDVLMIVPSRIIERKGIKEAVFALFGLPGNFYLILPAAFDPLDKDYWAEIVSSYQYKSVKHRIIIPDKPILYDEMPGLYGACDIIVMPSYYEGAPVATVEAMAVGKPFVAADCQGINGFIRHEENGLLVPKKAINELAAAILRISKDKEFADKLSNQARKDILQLSWVNLLPKLEATYDEIIYQTMDLRVQ